MKTNCIVDNLQLEIDECCYRELKLGVIFPNLDEGVLPSGLGLLTQLTKLDFQYDNRPNEAYQVLSSLRMLKDLKLRFTEEALDMENIHNIGTLLPMYTLTRLSFKNRCGQNQVGSLPQRKDVRSTPLKALLST
jgi:hypothetical protein